jgi:hypothetical protein
MPAAGGGDLAAERILDRFQTAGLVVETALVLHEGDESDPVADLHHAR